MAESMCGVNVYACTMCYNMFTNVCIKIQDNNLRNKSKTNKNN